MAEVDDDNVIYPLTDNDDLRAAGLVPKDDDDIHEDVVALLGINVGSGSAPINLDVGDGGGGAAMATGTRIGSISIDGTSSVGKRKSGVWAYFEDICETVNGNSVRIAAICRMCKSRLSARSATSTGHLIRHQKSCRKKTDHAARVQSRLALNPGGLHN
jgi:hypothetical protein